MTPERWQQVKEILHGALQKEPGERSVFLEQACQADPLLQLEVESLLASAPDVAEDFLKSLSPESFNRAWLGKGTRLASYEIVNLIGVGGMGEVYRAHDPRLGRDVAIKVLPRAFIKDPDRLRRFGQEARAAAALNHPNILAIYDIGTTEQAVPYVVSELLEGETLRECLRRGPLPVRTSVDLTLQITKGLAAAHEKGIVHRDLKPENLFLTTDGGLKILDFGLAKAVKGLGLSSDSPTLTGNTEAGAVMGTVGYMPPEQVRGQPIDQRCDIFAVGAVIYEMLSGSRAFPGDTAADAINAVLSRDPAPLSETNPALSPALQRVIQRCLEKNPNQRFHSVRDVAFALEAISDGSTPHLSRDARPTERRRAGFSQYVMWTLAAVVLALMPSLYFLYRTANHPHTTREWSS